MSITPFLILSTLDILGPLTELSPRKCDSFGDPREVVRDLCGAKVAGTLEPFWGLDEEGEIRSVWRYSGHERLWNASGASRSTSFRMTVTVLKAMMIGPGNFSMARSYSRYLALRECH